MEPDAFTDQLNHHRLTKAYLRLAAESKKIKESPGVAAIYGEAPTPKKKPKQPKPQPPEQLRLF